ncbi:MAG: hypothetical protein AB1611_11315 [bacterium]
MSKERLGFLKVLIFSFVFMTAIGFTVSRCTAQVLDTQVMLTNEFSVGIGANPADPDAYLVDNFEYWKDPRDMGWQVKEPAYPVWGYNVGKVKFATTTVDFQEGSRVLDVSRPFSVFLFNTPYQGYKMTKTTQYIDATGAKKYIPGAYSVFSVKMNGAVGIEPWCLPSPFITFDTTNFKNITIRLTGRGIYPPTEGTPGSPLKDGSTITVQVGREFQDGTWHLICEDLEKILDSRVTGENITQIKSVSLGGNRFKMDDVMFTKPAKSVMNNEAPYLFRIGTIYAQLFNPADVRIIYAEDKDLGMNLEWDTTQQKYVFKGIQDNNGIFHGQAGFNPNTARFAAPKNPQTDNLFFKLTVGDPLGPVYTGAAPMPLDPDNIPFMYIPHYGVPASLWVTNKFDTNGAMVKDATNTLYVLAKALQAAGYTTWPGVLVLTPTTGQVLEDMVICCRVTDGLLTDEEIFPVSVVNFDVTNHPPLIEQLEDQFFTVGDMGVCQITATDPDLQDCTQLTYKATLNGIPSYQYGPWMDQIIHPVAGTVSFIPQFEGALTCEVTVSDPRGMSAVGTFTIFCVNPGTWLNHPPVVTSIIQSPQVIDAGQMFILNELNIVDPDNEILYYSCNVGAVGRDGIYTFQSQFPGEYLVQITAYDIHGAYVTQSFVLQVKPWWSY